MQNMTALVYAYQNMASRMTLGEIGIAQSFRFAEINRKGTLTFCLLAVMLLGSLQYIGALYAVFSVGLRLQTENRHISSLSQEVDALEVRTQRASANFSMEHKDLLDSMEKISQVKYITGTQETVSYVSSQ